MYPLATDCYDGYDAATYRRRWPQRSLALVTPPAAEPVTVQECYDYLRLGQPATDAAQAATDNLFATFAAAAREYAEAATGLRLVSQVWRLALDRFSADPVELPGPLAAVTGVTYLDGSGVRQTLDPAAYEVYPDATPGYVRPAYGGYWPSAELRPGSVQITCAVGWPVTAVALATSAGTRAVTPASMAGIYAGSVLACDSGTSQERVVVASVTGTTFTATFLKDHAAGWMVNNVPQGLRQVILDMVNFKYQSRQLSPDVEAPADWPKDVTRQLMAWKSWVYV